MEVCLPRKLAAMLYADVAGYLSIDSWNDNYEQA